MVRNRIQVLKWSIQTLKERKIWDGREKKKIQLLIKPVTFSCISTRAVF